VLLSGTKQGRKNGADSEEEEDQQIPIGFKITVLVSLFFLSYSYAWD